MKVNFNHRYNKVLALAYNYKDLNAEFGMKFPLVFIKANNSVTTQKEIGISHLIKNDPELDLWSEVELGFIVSEECKNVSKENAHKYIGGYIIGNDLTRRNIDKADHHLALSKSLDNFCPISEFMVKDLDTSNLQVKTRINGRETQNGNTGNRLMNDFEVLEYLSFFFTLNKGDIILTGTPRGAMDSQVRPGDTAELEIENIGVLVNTFV